MDRDKWLRILSQFQARARGYLVRTEVGCARQDFEDIVRDIDGDLRHLRWFGSVLPAPHFTDTDDLFLPCSDVSKSPDSGLGASASPQSPAASSESPKAGTDRTLLLPQKTQAERDGSRTRGRARVTTEDLAQRGDGDSSATESTGNATSVWSSLELDVTDSYSHQGLRQASARAVPRSPEPLRLHRNTLTMELLWLQQAIDSRKKYLSLKNSLSVS